MSVGRRDGGQTEQRARRRQARQIVGEYHRQQLGMLLEHVRESLERLDRGEIDLFEVDELIERYQRAARKLWAFCGSRAQIGSGPPARLSSCARTARRTTGGKQPPGESADCGG